MRADERSRAGGSRGLGGLAGLLVVAGALAGGTACKPSVEISFDQNRFDRVVSVGAMSAVCDASTRDVSPDLRFALLDQRSSVIVPGTEQLIGYTLELNENFSVENLSLLGNQRLFPSPDIPCGALGEGAACPVAAYADAGFTCQRPSDGGSDIDGLICALQTTVNIDANRPIEFIEPGPVDVVLLASAGDSMFGIDPCVAVSPTWRSDPGSLRVAGFNAMVLSLEAGPVSDESFYCPAAYREAGTLDFIGASARTDECLLRPAEVVSGNVNPNDEFRISALNRGTNNYLAALEDLFEIYPTLGRQGDLHVVLFTDGPLAEDDLRENAATGTTYESVIAQAQALGATIHVQQLDNRPPSGRGIPAGNLFELQGLACATNGTHSYVQDPASTTGYLRNVGSMIPAHYRARININTLSQLPIGAYSVEAVLEATVNNFRSTFAFSAGGTVAQSTVDTRFSVYNRGACDPDATGGINACQGGRVCEAGVCVPAYETLLEQFPSPVITDEAVIECVEDEGLCVEDCGSLDDCVVLDVANLPNDNRVLGCIPTSDGGA